MLSVPMNHVDFFILCFYLYNACMNCALFVFRKSDRTCVWAGQVMVGNVRHLLPMLVVLQPSQQVDKHGPEEPVVIVPLLREHRTRSNHLSALCGKAWRGILQLNGSIIPQLMLNCCAPISSAQFNHLMTVWRCCCHLFLNRDQNHWVLKT